MLPRITAVISFCSNDFRFLKACINGVQPFCRQVMITVCDHFFDGSLENYSLLEEAYRSFPECTFLLFSYDENESYRPFSPLYPEHPNWRHEWHNTGRLLSYFYSHPDSQYLFFLDADEIVDSDLFIRWLNKGDLDNASAMRFAVRWYFREAKYAAQSDPVLSLMVNKNSISPHFLWDEDERAGLFQRCAGKKLEAIFGDNKTPMIHHYSGVRPKKEFIKKCKTWGHHWERDWKSLIEEEFSHPFSGRDFVRGYQYHEVRTAFDPLSVSVPRLPKIPYEKYLKNLRRFSNVIMVSREEIFKKQLSDEFSLGDNH